MKTFRLDLHVHTALSPCASLAMSPTAIVDAAVARGFSAIAITDHNSTLNCAPCIRLGEQYGLKVFPGAEVNSREEVHCLALFENMEKARQFQHYLDANITRIANQPEIMGDQPVTDENEIILDEVPWYLGAALRTGIADIIKKIQSLGGLAIPSHIYRRHSGLVSQLGFCPPGLEADALEVCSEQEAEKAQPLGYPLIVSSDSHTPGQIGIRYIELEAPGLQFADLRLALSHREGRNIKLLYHE